MIDLRDHIGIVRKHLKMAPFALREDCEQAGMVGLWKASQRFDESKGAHFTTFADYYVRGAIMDEIRSHQFGSRHHHRERPVSLEAVAEYRAPGNDRFRLSDWLDHLAEVADPTDPYADVDFYEDFRRLILWLPIQQWYVVHESVLRDRTATSIGRDLGVTQSRVSQIRSQAFATLRQVVAA